MVFRNHVRKHNAKLRRFGALALAMLLAWQTGRASALASEEKLEDYGFYFDTIVTIRLYGTSDQEIMDGCFDLMLAYEQMFSKTIEGSDVWNINHSEGAPTQVSEETADLIELALSYSEMSDGAFDITVAPVAELWDFENNTGILPGQEEIEEAVSHVNYKNVRVEGTTVTLLDPKASIDLGGVAKGYIADGLRSYLESEGIQSAMINLGGNVLAVGAKPGGSQWNIGIRKPFGESYDLIATVKVEDMSVVTSGTYERYFEKDGEIYHHILDPNDGYPTDNGLDSVTILTPSSTQGDALSTTCFVLGLEAGMELIESIDGVEAMFITEDLEIYRTSGFPTE